MKKLVLICTALLVALIASGFHLLGGGLAATIGVPEDGVAVRRDDTPRRELLQKARRTCEPSALDRFIEEQRALVAAEAENSEPLGILAEALLERVLLRNLERGMVVGAPMYDEVPQATETDLQEGLSLVEKARQLGSRCADLCRIEAALLSNRITGITAAFRLNRRIQEAFAEAAKIDDRNPALHVALGLRKLLAPRLLGHDPEAALDHFEFAALAMPDDERPRVFAGMAAFLQRKRERAIEWLQRAVAVNPNNTFARAVLLRLKAGEADPFSRDLSESERGR